MPVDDNMILRTVYLPPMLDTRLKGIAFRLGTSKNALIRSFVADAMAHGAFAAVDGPATDTDTMVLRTVYLPRDVDTQLRTIAFEAGRSKNDLIRQFVAAGLVDYPVLPFGEDTPVILSPSRIRSEPVAPAPIAHAPIAHAPAAPAPVPATPAAVRARATPEPARSNRVAAARRAETA